MHSALATQHSQVLAKQVGGPWKEAQEEVTALPHIDPSTFVRFSQYAYTGRYDAPKAEVIDARAGDVDTAQEGTGKVIDGEDSGGGKVPAVPDYWNPPFSNSKKKAKKTKDHWGPNAFAVPEPEQSQREKLWGKFLAKDNGPVAPSFNPKDQETVDDYTNVFLSHAELYSFADYYQIDPLADLVVLELRETLSNITELHSVHLASITELLKYTYSGTLDRKGRGGNIDRTDEGEKIYRTGQGKKIDKLRELVVHYAACIVEFLQDTTDFQELLEEKGELGRDLIGIMLRRFDTFVDPEESA